MELVTSSRRQVMSTVVLNPYILDVKIVNSFYDISPELLVISELGSKINSSGCPVDFLSI